MSYDTPEWTRDEADRLLAREGVKQAVAALSRIVGQPDSAFDTLYLVRLSNVLNKLVSLRGELER